jgi:hypothetical protein
MEILMRYLERHAEDDHLTLFSFCLFILSIDTKMQVSFGVGQSIAG